MSTNLSIAARPNPISTLAGLTDIGTTGIEVAQAATPAAALDAQKQLPRSMLPATIDAVVGDELQIFTRAVIEDPAPYALPHQFASTVGSDYERYFDYTPVGGDVGTKTLTTSILGMDNSTVLATASASLNVVSAVSQPGTQKNILCFGDSLTAGGEWVGELARRIQGTGGTPTAKGYGNTLFVGDKQLGSDTTQGYDGFGGWTAARYLGTEFPTGGHILTGQFDKTPQDVGSTWSDGTNSWQIAWTSASVGTGSNLVSNPDFETHAWHAADADHWTFQANYNGTAVIENSIVHGGAKAVKVVRGSTDVNWYDSAILYNGRDSAYLTLTAGTTYLLTFWTRGDGTNPGVYSVYDVTATNYVVANQTTGVSGTAYTQVSKSFTVPASPAGNHRYYLYFCSPSVVGGTAYYDDVSVTSQATNTMKVIGTGTIASSGTLTHTSGATNTASVSWTAATTEPMSPFWDATSGRVNFAAWCTRKSLSGIGVVYILLGWNNWSAGTQSATDVQTLIDKIHTDFPSAKVHILGIPNPSCRGGLAANYGSSISLAHYMFSLKYANTLALAYAAIAANASYSAFVKFVDTARQFDSENNYPNSATAVNTRSATTELRDTNGIHPATAGYYQIADAAYRDFIASFCQGS